MSLHQVEDLGLAVACSYLVVPQSIFPHCDRTNKQDPLVLHQGLLVVLVVLGRGCRFGNQPEEYLQPLLGVERCPLLEVGDWQSRDVRSCRLHLWGILLL